MIRLRLSGSGLQWSQEFAVKDILKSPVVDRAESHAQQSLLRARLPVTRWVVVKNSRWPWLGSRRPTRVSKVATASRDAMGPRRTRPALRKDG